MTSNRSEAARAARVVRLLLVAASACAASGAFAQTMYRCGSSFQDHPCTGGQAGVVIGSNPVPQAPRAASGGTAAPSVRCTQLGIAAQKISWSREAGKTEAEQAATANGDRRALIAEVYARRGSSVEVRASIESDCAAAEAREQAAAMASAGARPNGGLGLGSGAAPGIDSAPQPDPAPTRGPRPDNAAANDAARKAATCKQLQTSRDNIAAQQRSPHSQAGMEQLREQYRSADESLRKAGC